MQTITLATLSAATEQQVFDQVARHLLLQGKRAARVSLCAYRGDEGTMCAAGCLISDDEYAAMDDTFTSDRPGPEGTAWIGLVGRGLAPEAHRYLISTLQHLHDSVSPAYWRAALLRMAEDRDLDTSAVLYPITLANLATATAQQVFDQVSRHLLTQAAKAAEQPGGLCRYLTKDGRKCAAGCLISAEEYQQLLSTPRMDGIGPEGLLWSQVVEKGWAPQQHKGLILELQRIHDGSMPEDWRGRLRSLARKLDLDPSVLDKGLPTLTGRMAPAMYRDEF